MPEYAYRAIDEAGQQVRSTIVADDMALARRFLRDRNLLPIEILEGKAASSGPGLGLNTQINIGFLKPKKVKVSALAQFCRQLSVAIASGVNILSGMQILADMTPNRGMREETQRMLKQLQTGSTLAETMHARHSLIPDMLASMVATGESTGTLDSILKGMAAYYDREHRIKQKLQSAAVYPVIMLLVAAGLLTFFFTMLLPQIATLVSEGGGELPLLTRIVIAIGDFLKQYFVGVIVVALVAFFAILRWFRTAKGAMFRDTVINHIPILGRTMRSVATMRLARTSYILVHNGYPLLDGLEFVRRNVGNALAQRAVTNAIDGVRRGEPLGSNLGRSGYFDGLAIQMVTMGESTGELDIILSEMADFYETESDIGFARLVALVEPMMLVVVGGIVSIIILAVMIPMLTMFQYVGGQ